MPKILITLLLASLAAILYFLFRRPNEKTLDQPFPEAWRKVLSNKVNFYQRLSKTDQRRFEQDVLMFLDRVTVTGVETEVTDIDCMLVASSAVIPLFGFPDWSYRNLKEVLLYGKRFNRDYETEGADRRILGMVGSGVMNRMMILSKPALHQGFDNEHSKNNVGIHEFVHLLDKLDGDTDGIPEALMARQYTIPWVHLMHELIAGIKAGDTSINPYGATNEAEFLSVVAEFFFTQPSLLKQQHPELFDLLETIFRQDLA